MKKFFNQMASNSLPLSQKETDDILLMMLEKSHPNAATSDVEIFFRDTVNPRMNWYSSFKLKITILHMMCLDLLKRGKQKVVVTRCSLGQCFF